jgi:2-keto-4-pentenoate hydratase/2-oxohepta-3-ene-1,7-dioic acid hydratase in catechol pathway
MDKILCAGKNNKKHAEELGDAPPKEPVFFIKPPSCLFLLGGAGGQEPLELPKHHGSVHHELELVFKIRKDEAKGDISLCAWTVGLDLTLRDLQSQLKKSGHPWERAKAFPRSAVIGEFIGFENGQAEPSEDNLKEVYELKVNGETRQKGQAKDLIWSPQQLLQEASKAFLICDGDLLFTGTPEGVGPLKAGDHLEIRLGERLHYVLDVV